MVVLDIAIVNVALPSIQQDLGIVTPTHQPWWYQPSRNRAKSLSNYCQNHRVPCSNRARAIAAIVH
jgi:hypothetical protein